MAKDSVASFGNKKMPITDSVSYSQNNPAEDHITSNDDVGCDFNNSCESALDQCGDWPLLVIKKHNR